MEEAIAVRQPAYIIHRKEADAFELAIWNQDTDKVLFNLNLINLSRRRWTPKGTRYPGRGPIGRPSSRVSRHLAVPSEDNAAQKKAAAEGKKAKAAKERRLVVADCRVF
ncbi:hypothetical protein VDGL01_05407 [Verticillium dahliae]|nr:Putative exoglucanase type C [Verticillium dahliae VDG2]